MGMSMTKAEATAFAAEYELVISKGGTAADVAEKMGIASRTVRDRRIKAEAILGRRFLDQPGGAVSDGLSLSRAERIELSSLRADKENVERLRRLYEGGLGYVSSPPDWLHKAVLKPKCLGVPTLMLSDLHWGESVDAKQINGVNEYDLKIARKRLRRVIDTTITMLFDHITPGNYPGMVLVLGGDMVSGNIHEELRETNDDSILAIVLDLFDNLVASIDLLLKYFPHIFVPCVVGNHGRMDKKPRAKGAVQDNFEWILYQLLQRHYALNARVTVVPSDSLDYVYKVFNTTYLLTHGDQFRGGSGIAGPFTPWALGDHKKRKRQNAIDQPYDYMIFGHFHTLVWGPSWIVNGSLKGYDEYSFRSNFGFEPPQQALWITHPKHGITVKMEVQAEETKRLPTAVPWVQVRGA